MQILATHQSRMLLRFLHILAVCIWTGGGMAVLVLLYDDRQSCSGDELSAYNHAIRSIDDYLIKPAAAGTLISGALLCLLGNRGLLRQSWVMVKCLVTVAAIIFGAFCLGPWFRELAAFGRIDTLSAHAAGSYQRLFHLGVVFGSVQTAVLLVLVLVSILKPDFGWRGPGRWGRLPAIPGVVRSLWARVAGA